MKDSVLNFCFCSYVNNNTIAIGKEQRNNICLEPINQQVWLKREYVYHEFEGVLLVSLLRWPTESFLVHPHCSPLSDSTPGGAKRFDLTVHRSLLTAYGSPLSDSTSLFTAHRSPLTAYGSPLSDSTPN